MLLKAAALINRDRRAAVMEVGERMLGMMNKKEDGKSKTQAFAICALQSPSSQGTSTQWD